MISIVIPLYNKEGQIANTLRTVLAQTYKDFEIVIVNDGSTDRSVDEVAKFTDPRIRLINQQNAGVSAARNHGIKEAKGEYIALLDADDEWKPDYLETQMSMTKQFPEAKVFATNYEFRDTSGKVTPTILRNIRIDGNTGILDNYFEVASTSHPPLWTSAIMALKEALEAVGGFPVGVRLGEDLITWAKLACKYKIAYNITPKAIYIFASQDKRVVPIIQPNNFDKVGEEFQILVDNYNIPYLGKMAALWHKMRMATFIQLQRRKEARLEFAKIKSFITPSKKDWIWYLLSYMPYPIIRYFIKNKAKLQNN